ncbi:hypothetical protein CR513_09644, partial [Mucuna pruriens]
MRVLPFVDHFLVEFHPFIEDIIYVKAYGNYGYCAIATQLGMGEESWFLVHQELTKELQQWKDDYTKLFGKVNHHYLSQAIDLLGLCVIVTLYMLSLHYLLSLCNSQDKKNLAFEKIHMSIECNIIGHCLLKK